MTSDLNTMICPFCEDGSLRFCGPALARCTGCEAPLSGSFLKTLREISGLPDALGRHACECGHPEMRRLPDEWFWCPACGSEVVSLTRKESRDL